MRLAALASVALLTLATCARRIWATDFWWQIATGRYVLEHGWPRGDVFSYTVPGAEWIELRWIFFVVEALLFDHLGAGSLVALKCLIVTATFATIAWPFSKRVDATVLSAVIAIAVLAASQRFFVRPELTSWLLIAVFAVAAHRFRSGAGRGLWWLLALQLLWVNSHPLFFFGPAILACAAVASLWDRRERVKPLAAVALAAGAVSLINPYGIKGLLFPVTLFLEIRDSLFSEIITELASPFAVEQGQVAFLFYRVLIGVAVLTTAINWRRIDPFWLLLAIPQLYLSVVSLRNLPLFAICAVPLVLHNLSSFEIPRKLRLVLGTVVIVGSLFCVQQLVTDRWYVRQGDSNAFGFGIAAHRYPIALAPQLPSTRREMPGQTLRVFGSMRSSAYLLSRGWLTFLDPRTEVYGEEVYREWIEAQRDPETLEALLDRYEVDRLVFDAGDPALQTAVRLKSWRFRHLDSSAISFVRTHGAGDADLVFTKLLDEIGAPRAWNERRPWQRVDSPTVYLRIADSAYALGAYEAAGRALDHAQRAAPWLDLSGNRAALELAAEAARADGALERAQALVEAGDVPGAAAVLGEAVQEFPDRWQPRAALARLAASAGQRAAAIRGIELALELEPDEPSMLEDLWRWNLEEGRTAEAERALARLRAVQRASTTPP